MHRFAGRPASEKNVTIIEELSPDALFIRSTLRINGAEFSDFGPYTCRVINSLNRPDELRIHLKPSSPTGKCGVQCLSFKSARGRKLRNLHTSGASFCARSRNSDRRRRSRL